MTARVLDICQLLHKHMKDGRVTPFLGAGATRAGRRRHTDWRKGNYLPDGAELAEFLATEYTYPIPESEPRRDLERVAQYADLVSGSADLVRDLHATFAGEQKPNLVHHYLAGQVARARKSTLQNPWPVIVTTNYDDLLEQAFAQAGLQCHVLTYFSTGGRGGKPIFVHQPPDGKARPITKVKEYNVCEPEEGRTVIIKLHGSVSRAEPPHDSFVITENDYIAYIESRVQRLLPAHLLHTMRDGHFLFLGYKLEDWHVRAFLFALWRRRAKSAKSWAIELDPTMVASKYWQAQGVEVVKLSLKAWVENMLALQAPGGEP
jgi:hypothetical protein